jgi:ferredoxin-like protein FixX
MENRTAYQKAWHFNRNLPIKEWIYNYLKRNKCVDCGENDVLTLDFDHVTGNKRFNIARAFMDKNMTIEILAEEINECEVRCRNCHVIRTHKVNDSWKYRMDRKGSS